MNQLLLDLSALKAEVLLDWGQGSYCHCLVGKMAKVTGVPVKPFGLGESNDRFEILRLKVREVAGTISLTRWNDRKRRTQADVVRLIQDTFDRESRR